MIYLRLSVKGSVATNGERWGEKERMRQSERDREKEETKTRKESKSGYPKEIGRELEQKRRKEFLK